MLVESNNIVKVFAKTSPFRSDRISSVVEVGTSLEEIVGQVGLLEYNKDEVNIHCFVEDIYYPREVWNKTYPEANSIVSIAIAPMGGGQSGGGKNPMRTIAMIGVIALATWVSGGAGGMITSKLVAGLAGAAVGIGGSMLANQLLPVSTNESSVNSAGDVYSISGSRNEATPWHPIPKLFGKHKIFPRYAAKPYTEIQGQDQYLRMLFCLGYAPLDISELKIGETSIDNFDEVEWLDFTYTNDMTLPPIYPGLIYEDSLSVQCTYNNWIGPYTSQTDTDEISVDITFPEGLVDIKDDGGHDPMTVQLSLEWREATGPGSWVSIDDQAKLMFTRPYSEDSISVGATVTGGTSSTVGTVIRLITVVHRSPGGRDDPIVYTTYYAGVVVEISSGPGYDVDETVTISGSTSRVLESVYSYVFSITADHPDLLRYSIKFDVYGDANDQYDVRIMRLTADTSAPDRSDSYWTALRSITKETPWTLEGIQLLAVRIKASDQLNGVIDSLNCIGEARSSAYSGGSWQAEATTRSPAWAYADVLTHFSNQRAISASLLDGAGLATWASNCSSAGREYNRVVYNRTTVLELLQEIAAAGRASYSQVDGVYSIIEDTTNTTIRQHFSQRNAWNIKGIRDYPDVPDALRCRFNNEDTDYEQDERVVCNDGYYYEIPDASTWQGSHSYDENDYVEPTSPNGYYYRCIDDGTSSGGEPSWPTTPGDTVVDGGCEWICEDEGSRIEVMNMPGVTDPDQVWKLGRYHIACQKLRQEVFTFECDPEIIECTRGDLIRLTYDAALIGYGAARITAVSMSGADCDGVTMDDVFPMELGGSYGARIRLDDGSSVTANVVTDAGEQTEIEFSPVLSGSDIPSVGDLITFGEQGLESIPCIIISIAPSKDMTAKVTCIPYQSGVYTADSGTIPPWNPGISVPPEVNRTCPNCTIDYITYDPNSSYFNNQGELIVAVDVGVQISGDEAKYLPWDSIEAQVRVNGTDIWRGSSGESKQKGVARFYLPNNVSYDYRVRTINTTSYVGATSAWTEDLDNSIAISTAGPSTPTLGTPVPIEDGVRFVWEYKEKIDRGEFITFSYFEYQYDVDGGGYTDWVAYDGNTVDILLSISEVIAQGVGRSTITFRVRAVDIWEQTGSYDEDSEDCLNNKRGFTVSPNVGEGHFTNIQTALDYLETIGGGSLYFKNGTYAGNAESPYYWSVPDVDIQITGETQAGVILQNVDTYDCFYCNNYTHKFVLTNVTIDSQNSTSESKMVHFYATVSSGAPTAEFINVTFDMSSSLADEGIRHEHLDPYLATFLIEKCNFLDGAVGINIGYTATSKVFNARIINNYFDSNSYAGAILDHTQYAIVDKNTIVDFEYCGIIFTSDSSTEYRSKISDNSMISLDAAVTGAQVAIYAEDAHVDIQNNTIHVENQIASTYFSFGVYLITSNYSSIVNNKIYVDASTDYAVSNYPKSCGVFIYDSNDFKVIDNGIVINDTSGGAAATGPDVSGVHHYRSAGTGYRGIIRDNNIQITVLTDATVRGIVLLDHYNGLVTGNSIVFSNSDTTSNHIGIHLDNSDHNQIESNQIDGQNSDAKDIGIYLESDTDDNIGANNIASNCGTNIVDNGDNEVVIGLSRALMFEESIKIEALTDGMRLRGAAPIKLDFYETDHTAIYARIHLETNDDLYLGTENTTDKSVVLRTYNGASHEYLAIFTGGGQCRFYHDGTETCRSYYNAGNNFGGVEILRDTSSGRVVMDNDDDSLLVYNTTADGKVVIRGIKTGPSYPIMADFDPAGASRLYYDNVIEGQTQSGYWDCVNGLRVGGAPTITSIKDEDDMSSDSATALCTQQSIKAYVDDNSGGWTYGSQTTLNPNAYVDFTSIPSTVEDIELIISGASLSNMTNRFYVQIGDSGGIENSGYYAFNYEINAGGNAQESGTTYIPITESTGSSITDTYWGVVRLRRWDTSEHLWFIEWKLINYSGGDLEVGVARKTLSAALDRIRLGVSGGTMDAGEARIRYR